MTMAAGTAYPGSKNGSGVCERLISLMPVHRVYVAAFAGHDAIFFRKRPGALAIMVDRDPAVCAWWDIRGPSLRIVCADFLEVASKVARGSADPVSPSVASLQSDRVTLEMAMRASDTLLYVDPPYLRSTRSTRRLWQYELDDEESHLKLLRALRALPCMVMLSGYPSALYSSQLQGWRCELYRVMTRGGLRHEAVWMNYPANLPLHDCRYVGGTFRGRERLRRRCGRWVSRFARMPPAERQVIYEALSAAMEPGPNVASDDADRHADSDDARGHRLG